VLRPVEQLQAEEAAAASSNDCHPRRAHQRKLQSDCG